VTGLVRGPAEVGERQQFAGIQAIDQIRRHVQFGHAGVSGRVPGSVHQTIDAVLVRVDPDRCGLHAQRHVLRHERHGAALGGEVEGHGQDA
jgi:hypothetical protein